MMKYKIINIHFRFMAVLLFLVETSSFAQKTTVNQAIERAFTTNASLKIMNMEAESQRKMVLTARELPKAGIELQMGRIQAYNSMDYTLGASQSFNHPKYYKTLATLLNKQVSVFEQNQNIRKNELAYQIKQIYAQLSHLKYLQSIVNQQDSVYQVAKKIARIRKETGEGSKLEVVTAEAELDANAQRLKVFEIEEKQLIQRLNFLLNIPKGESLTPVLEDISAEKALSINTLSVENNPLFIQQNNHREITQSQISVEKSRLLPEFKAGFFNQSMEKRYTPLIILGGMSIPLSSKPQKARIESLQIQEQVVVENQQYIKKEIEQQLQNQLLNYEKFQFMDKYYKETALPKDEILLDLTYKRYQNAEALYHEYIQMIQKVYEVKEKYFMNLFDKKQTINEIEFLIGKEL